MIRRLGTVVAVLTLLMSSAPAGGAIPTRTQTPLLAQASSTAAELLPGDIYDGDGYQLSAGFFSSYPSPDFAAATDFRVTVMYRNTSPDPIPYWQPGISPGVATPDFALRDADGVIYELDTARPTTAVLDGSAVDRISADGIVRWTLGFRTPTARAEAVALLAIVDDVIVSEWDLSVEEALEPVWERPALPIVRLDEVVPWGVGLDVVPRGTGSLICGDPGIEQVAHLFAVTFDVTNDTIEPTRWPGVRQQDPWPLAQWDDGSAATMSLETYWGEAETLTRFTADSVIVPPLSTFTRAMVFSAPRDGRFADTSSLPLGVRLPTINGELWLDTEELTPTVALDPSMCDLGGFGAPIPYAFAPGPIFEVGGSVLLPTTSAQNRAAEALLAEARSAAILLYDANGRNIRTIDNDDFAGVAPNLTLIEFIAGSSFPLGRSGEIFFDTDSGRSRFLFLATRSESGDWVCSGGDVFSVPTVEAAATLSAAGTSCYPDAFRTGS